MRYILVLSCLLISSESLRSFHRGFSRYGSTCRLQCTPLPSIEGLRTAIIEEVDIPLVTVESGVTESSQISLQASIIDEAAISDQAEVSADSDEKEVLDPYVEYDCGRLRKEDLPHLPGVYVLELENNCIYVGKSNQNVEARVKEHFNSGGSAFTKRFKPIRQLEPLTQPSIDLESTERAETLEQMWVNGIKNVRGWQYTKLFLSEFEYESIFRQMCERKDLCRFVVIITSSFSFYYYCFYSCFSLYSFSCLHSCYDACYCNNGDDDGFFFYCTYSLFWGRESNPFHSGSH